MCSISNDSVRVSFLTLFVFGPEINERKEEKNDRNLRARNASDYAKYAVVCIKFSVRIHRAMERFFKHQKLNSRRMDSHATNNEMEMWQDVVKRNKEIQPKIKE